MTQQTPHAQAINKQDIKKYLVYAAIALLALNSLLLLLPAIETYQPHIQKTSILGITYDNWHTDSASMIDIVFPAFLTFLPYLAYLGDLIAYKLPWKKKELLQKKFYPGKDFIQLLDNTLAKPARFILLKFAAIAHVVVLLIAYAVTKSEADDLAGRIKSNVENGKVLEDVEEVYCHITAFGILSIICSIVFLVLLFVLSYFSKFAVKPVDTTTTATPVS